MIVELMGKKWDNVSILEQAREFQRSRILLSAVELEIFPILAPGALSVEEVAGKIGADVRGTGILLDALTALELLEKKDGRYILPLELVPFLSDESVETSVLPMLRHWGNLWLTWSNLTEVVRSGYSEAVFPDGKGKEVRQKAFIEAMHVTGLINAKAIVSRVDLKETRKLLDIGGGSGVYTIAFLIENPDLSAFLFDLPPVLEITRNFISRESLLDRVELVPGNFQVDELPGGCDTAWLSAIIHQNSLSENMKLFSKIHTALLPGGRLIIRDHIMEPDRITPRDGAIFAINMLVGTKEGSTYTFDEIRGLLEKTGFSKIRLERGKGKMDDLIICEK